MGVPHLKIRTDKALLSSLIIKHFEFDAINNREHKERELEYIMSCLLSCKRVLMDHKEYYRARRIYGESHGIFWANGIPQNGYSSSESGVAPAQFCKSGRVNDKYEQVLYISEDVQTAIKEVRTPLYEYASVASCMVENDICVFDFSPYTEEELEKYALTSEIGKDDELISKVMLFIKIQRILTLEEYSEYDYKISRDLVQVIKKGFPEISGIKYISHFTGNVNYALWDENKFLIFSEGNVVVNNE